MPEVDYDHANPRFPEGLRVLVVDDNEVCLKLLSALLKKCNYKVTATTKAAEALDMLRTNKDGYDIVITDVVMLDMDGFQLLEKIGLEMDIPVILVSANDDTEFVMKAVRHGARDYLLKPVQLKELKHIWQHVVRKKLLLDPIKSGSIKVQTGQGPTPSMRPKEKDKEKGDETNSIQSEGESPARKKQRLVWSKELHEKFADAVRQLGVDKAVPKKILRIMNEPELSRENVASHLQKHRKSLNRGIGKDRANQDVENNIHSNKTPKAAPASSSHECYNAVNQQNRSVEQGIGNAGINSIRYRLQRVGASLANKRPLIYNSQEMLPRQNLLAAQMAYQGMLPQQNLPAPQMAYQGQNLPAPQTAYQMHPTMPSSMLGSGSPTPIYVRDPSPQPELSGMISQSFQLRRNMDDDYLDELSQIPGLNVCQPTCPGSMPVDLVPPYLLPGASNPVGGPFQMLGDASTQFTPLHRPDSQANLVPSSLHGQHEGRNLANNLNGRGETTGFSFDGQGQTMNDSIPDGQLVNVQYFFDDAERESNVQSDICSSLDDDNLSVIVKQFCSNSAPRLY